METITLRQGPAGDSHRRFIATENAFAVLFRNPVGGSQSAKSELRLPFVLNRNIAARARSCPPGLALFRVEPDFGSARLPGMENPAADMRDSAMNYLRSRIGKKDSGIAACYHTYREISDKNFQSRELVPSGALFVEFNAKLNAADHRRIFDHFRLLVDREITYWRGAYVVSVTQASGQNPLKLAQSLLSLKLPDGEYVLDYADPIFHRERTRPSLPRDPVFNRQWHLRNDGLSGGTVGIDIGAPQAWDVTRGGEQVRVAVIDDAFELANGSFRPEKILAPLNVHSGKPDVAPADGAGEWHGTSVLGLIGASHDGAGGCGIAPDCPLIPIKLEPLADDDAEARAFDHAVRQGASVINCSWGPYDNYSEKPWPMPRLTHLAVENAYRNRTAVVFAAGNGCENMETDGYASHPCVIAVSASTDRGERAPYSDYGERVWLCAPSSGGASGIVTSDVSDGGYNPYGGMTPDFGGTSAAAPIVSGVIALMQSAYLAANPGQERLSVEEVKAILRLTARDRFARSAPAFNDYWEHKLIDPAPREPDGHSVAFGYGCVDAAAAAAAARDWKRTAKNRKRLDALQQNTGEIRREPVLSAKRSPPRYKKRATDFTLPGFTVGDPFSIFHARRNAGFSPDERSRFNAGEHIWLGTQGIREACQALNIDFGPYATLSRGDQPSRETFSYGEIVALSGDFYGSPDDLFYEKPALIPWLWESNDLSDLKAYFDKEIEAIKRQMAHVDVAYPDFNIQFLWNAKRYAELAKNNVAHFGWHNMIKYCQSHTWALHLAVQSGGAGEDEDGPLWRKALFVNAFADHFLTDGFAAGHIRVPRREIIAWADRIKMQSTTGGFLSKLLHDQDGHLNTSHADGENRPENDGLHVLNAEGIDWWTHCDGQLFVNTDQDSPRLRQPIEAVKRSVLELFAARKNRKLPDGVFAATRHVPFPHPDEPKLSEKFDPAAKDKISHWVKSAAWYNFGVNEKNVTKLFKALPGLMADFRQAVAKDIEGD
ncbi:MAG: S8 family serine peptidase, partial [Gammaproteobacteria bacterium]